MLTKYIGARTWLTFYQRFGTFQWYLFVSQDAHWLSIKFILQHVQNIQRYSPACLSEDQGGANTNSTTKFWLVKAPIRTSGSSHHASRAREKRFTSIQVDLCIEGGPQKHTKEIRILTVWTHEATWKVVRKSLQILCKLLLDKIAFWHPEKRVRQLASKHHSGWETRTRLAEGFFGLSTSQSKSME